MKKKMNKINYQLELDKIIKKLQKDNKTPTLLMHSCCAPCSSYCLSYLAEYFKITIFYYNPNISPLEEYQKRVNEQKRLISELPVKNKICFEEGKYDPQTFFDMSKGLEDVPEGGIRCFKCYELRQREAAIYGINYLVSDFKKKGGYLKSIEYSKKYDLYRQNYCGCIYSRAEAEKRMKQEG